MGALDTSDDNLRDMTLQSFTGSALFQRTFDEGMSLVEETARYLDGPGREEQRHLHWFVGQGSVPGSERVADSRPPAASRLLPGSHSRTQPGR